jgi:hypothetical protein
MLEFLPPNFARLCAVCLVGTMVAACSQRSAFAEVSESHSGKPSLSTYRAQVSPRSLDASSFYSSGAPKAGALQAAPVSARERRLEAEKGSRVDDGRGDSRKPKLHTYRNSPGAQGEPRAEGSVVDGYDVRPGQTRDREDRFYRLREVNSATNGRESRLRATWLPSEADSQ